MRTPDIVFTAAELASRIDHTVLDPAAVRADLERACALALKYHFRAVYTNPYWCAPVAEMLAGSGIRAGISAAYPLGALPTKDKVREVMSIVEELQGKPCAVDMVANVGLLKERDFQNYTRDIAAVVKALDGIELKVIIESSLLNDEEIGIACRCAAEAGVNFAKTSTGRNGPPRLQDIRLMRANLPPEIGIKFSGFGTHNAPELAAFALACGANLLGSPQGDRIVDALCSENEYGNLFIDWKPSPKL